MLERYSWKVLEVWNSFESKITKKLLQAVIQAKGGPIKH